MMKNLAIIPARGGSKRIPRKNIKQFFGKPILTYSIEAVFKSELFDEVMVSTDDEEIVKIALEYGAKVPFIRSKATADDYAPLVDVIQEVINNYKNLKRSNFDNVCCILPTAPLITSNDIIIAYEKLISTDFVSVYPIVAFAYPILRSLSLDDDGCLVMNWPEYAKTRSQDLALSYHDSGTFYWHKIEPWIKGIRKSGGIVFDEIKVQDIDNETDWILAEMKFNLLKNRNG